MTDHQLSLRRLAAAAVMAALAACGAGSHAAPADKAGGSAKPSAPKVLSLVSASSSAADFGEFIDAVRRLSGGSLTIVLNGSKHSDDVDLDQKLMDDARSGRADLAQVGARAFDLNGVKTLDPLVAPFVVQSYAQQERVLESPLAGQMLAGVRPLGLVGVALVPGTFRHLAGVSRPIVTVADLGGARTGIRPSQVTRDALADLGAVPVGFAPLEPLTGLDALETDAVQIANNDYGPQTRSLLNNVKLWPRTQVIVMNAKSYAALSADQQALLLKAGASAVATQSGRVVRAEEASIAYLCRQSTFQVVQASESELATFRDRTAPVVDAIGRDATAGPILRGIQALASPTVAADEPAGCPATASATAVPRPAPTGDALKLVGTWTANVTEKAFLAAHPDGGELNSGNTGREALTLNADGTFVYASPDRPDDPDWPITGAWLAKGTEIDMTPGDTATIHQGAGDTWRDKWSVFHGKLSLTRRGQGDSPTALVAQPWSRKG